VCFRDYFHTLWGMAEAMKKRAKGGKMEDTSTLALKNWGIAGTCRVLFCYTTSYKGCDKESKQQQRKKKKSMTSLTDLALQLNRILPLARRKLFVLYTSCSRASGGRTRFQAKPQTEGPPPDQLWPRVSKSGIRHLAQQKWSRCIQYTLYPPAANVGRK